MRGVTQNTVAMLTNKEYEQPPRLTITISAKSGASSTPKNTDKVDDVSRSDKDATTEFPNSDEMGKESPAPTGEDAYANAIGNENVTQKNTWVRV